MEMTQTTVNDSATSGPARTRLTQRRSRAVRFEIIDAIDRVHGPFKNLAAAQVHIAKRFRLQLQDDERAGRYPTGWDIRVAAPRLRKPNRNKGMPSPHRGKGPGLAWLKANAGHESEECLTWPWSRNHQGYGQVGYYGKIRKAHHIMCLLVHGEPPTPEHHAAHSCMNGHLGCVHPGHLSWKTPTENRLEARPAPKGRRRLKPEIVLHIRNSPGSYLEIAAATGVYWGTVGKIKRGELYPNLT